MSFGTVKTEGSQAVISFGLCPGRSLRVALLEDVQHPANIAEQATTFHSDDSCHDDGRFAILAAHRIVSLNHIVAAANAALFRVHARCHSSCHPISISSHQHDPKKFRGIALDTVFSAGGSLNEAAVLKDFGFIGGNGA